MTDELKSFTIDGRRFTQMPTCCAYCPMSMIYSELNAPTFGMTMPKMPKSTYCELFDLHKSTSASIPQRCERLFTKAFTIGGALAVVKRDRNDA